MMKLRILLTLFALTLASNLFARFAGVYYDGVHYFINIAQGWAAVDKPSFSWEKYAGNVKVKAKVWETGIPNVSYPVVKIMSSAFADSPDLLSVELPSTLTGIGDNAFYNCPNLTSVNIPEGVTYIGENAFRSTKVNPKLPSTLKKIGARAFYSAGITSQLTIPQNVTEIGDEAFYKNDFTNLYFLARNCNKQIGQRPFPEVIQVIGFNHEVTVIPDYAFQNLQVAEIVGLNKDYLPMHLTYLGRGAFADCHNLRQVRISLLTSIGLSDYAFSNCSNLRYVSIPDITKIGSRAFYNCDKLSLLELGENLSSISSDSFGGSTSVRKTIWTAVEPISSAKYIPSKVSIVPSDKYKSAGIKNEIIVYPNLKQRFNINGVTYVPKNGAERLADIIGCTFDNSVREISISDPTVEYNGINFSLDKILPYAFAGNYWLNNVSITIPVEVQTGWFQNCDFLNNAVIPASTEFITGELFMNTSLKKFSLPESVSFIGDNAFSGCKSLAELNFRDKIREIGASAFEGCSSLSEMKLPESVELIKNRAFYNCSGMQTFESLGSLNKIGNEVFYNCGNLTNISLGHQLTSIGKDSFRGCEKIVGLNSYAVTPPAIESSAFNDIDKWNCTLHVPENSFESYSKSNGWKDFFKIENDLEVIEFSEISDIKIEQVSDIKVYSVNGNLVFEGTSEQFKKSMESLPSGIYIINSGNVTQKIRVK